MTKTKTTMVEKMTRLYLLTMYFFFFLLLAYLHTGSLINIDCFLPQELTACK